MARVLNGRRPAAWRQASRGGQKSLRRHDGTSEALPLAPDAGAYACDGPPANFVELILGKTTVNHSPGATST